MKTGLVSLQCGLLFERRSSHAGPYAPVLTFASVKDAICKAIMLLCKLAYNLTGASCL